MHHYSNIQNSFKVLKKIPSGLPIQPSPASWQSLAITFSIALPFLECHIFGIIQYVAFSNWLLPPSNMHLRFIRVEIPWKYSG